MTMSEAGRTLLLSRGCVNKFPFRFGGCFKRKNIATYWDADIPAGFATLCSRRDSNVTSYQALNLICRLRGD
jgi:hypothetical protein